MQVKLSRKDQEFILQEENDGWTLISCFKIDDRGIRIEENISEDDRYWWTDDVNRQVIDFGYTMTVINDYHKQEKETNNDKKDYYEYDISRYPPIN